MWGRIMEGNIQQIASMQRGHHAPQEEILLKDDYPAVVSLLTCGKIELTFSNVVTNGRKA